MKPFRFVTTKHPAKQQDTTTRLEAYWSLTTEQLLADLHTTRNGIQQTDAESRIKQYGLDALKRQRRNTAFGLLLSQFKSPPEHCLYPWLHGPFRFGQSDLWLPDLWSAVVPVPRYARIQAGPSHATAPLNRQHRFFPHQYLLFPKQTWYSQAPAPTTRKVSTPTKCGFGGCNVCGFEATAITVSLSLISKALLDVVDVSMYPPKNAINIEKLVQADIKKRTPRFFRSRSMALRFTKKLFIPVHQYSSYRES